MTFVEKLLKIEFRHLYMIAAFAAIFSFILVLGQSIRWERLKSGDFSSSEEQIDIPIIQITNAQPGKRYYWKVKHSIYIYSGEFPIIIRKEKIEKNPNIWIENND